MIPPPNSPKRISLAVLPGPFQLLCLDLADDVGFCAPVGLSAGDQGDVELVRLDLVVQMPSQFHGVMKHATNHHDVIVHSTD